MYLKTFSNWIEAKKQTLFFDVMQHYALFQVLFVDETD
jgi:hypothetical protein